MAAAKKVTVGVIVNGSKPGAKDVIYQVDEFAQSHPNLRLLFERRTGRLINRPGLTETALAKRSNVLLVAGGDGSLIDVVNSVYPSQTPILGVNIGSLGFLTAVAATEGRESATLPRWNGPAAKSALSARDGSSTTTAERTASFPATSTTS